MKLLSLRATYLRHDDSGEEEILTVNVEVGDEAVITAMSTQRWTDPATMNQAQYETKRAGDSIVEVLKGRREPYIIPGTSEIIKQIEKRYEDMMTDEERAKLNKLLDAHLFERQSCGKGGIELEDALHVRKCETFEDAMKELESRLEYRKSIDEDNA